MYGKLLLGSVFLISFGGAHAACTGGLVTNASLALSNQRIVASGGGDDWKEIHCSSGELKKVGAGTAVDPEVVIGSWSASGSDVTYKYNKPGGGTNNFTFELRKQGSTYYFCSGGVDKASGTLSSDSC